MVLRELRELFRFDLHEPWLMEDHVWKEMIIRRGGDSVGQKWQTISSGVQKDMESFEKNQARVPGGLKKVFHEQYRKSGEYEVLSAEVCEIRGGDSRQPG
jgi:hypothetical protein